MPGVLQQFDPADWGHVGVDQSERGWQLARAAHQRAYLCWLAEHGVDVVADLRAARQQRRSNFPAGTVPPVNERTI